MRISTIEAPPIRTTLKRRPRAACRALRFYAVTCCITLPPVIPRLGLGTLNHANAGEMITCVFSWPVRRYVNSRHSSAGLCRYFRWRDGHWVVGCGHVISDIWVLWLTLET